MCCKISLAYLYTYYLIMNTICYTTCFVVINLILITWWSYPQSGCAEAGFKTKSSSVKYLCPMQPTFSLFIHIQPSGQWRKSEFFSGSPLFIIRLWLADWKITVRLYLCYHEGFWEICYYDKIIIIFYGEMKPIYRYTIHKKFQAQTQGMFGH